VFFGEVYPTPDRQWNEAILEVANLGKRTVSWED
jgi:hypothetical protein